MFEAELGAMRSGHSRLDFAIESITPSIQVNPLAFHQIIGKQVRVAKLIAFEGVPDATIYFSFDETTIHLLSIKYN